MDREGSITAAYPVLLRKEEASDIHVCARDLRQVVTSGPNEAAALEMAADAIGVAVEVLIERNEELPAPSAIQPGERLVTLPAEAAAKLLVWRAWRASGLSKVALAERMTVGETEVRRLLDPRHGATLDAAARAMGERLVLTIEDAA